MRPSPAPAGLTIRIRVPGCVRMNYEVRNGVLVVRPLYAGVECGSTLPPPSSFAASAVTPTPGIYSSVRDPPRARLLGTDGA